MSLPPDPENAEEFGVPYGSRTRVAAVKEKRPIVIQRNFSGMDSTLPHLKDSLESLLDL